MMHSPLRAALEEVAATLTRAGLHTSADPSKGKAGAAIIFPTAIRFVTLDAFHLDAEVYALGNNRDGQLAVTDQLWTALAVVRDCFDVTEGEAVTFELSQGVKLPGLRIPLTLHITKE